MSAARPQAPRQALRQPLRQSGFTLLEVLLVTAIGGVVILMVATALNQSLRLWDRQRHTQERELPFFMELFKEQVAAFWPVTLKIDKKDQVLFTGNERSFALTTLRSVSGLHGGAPVIARYVFDPEHRRLAYAEIPIPGTLHMDLAEAFLKAEPQEEAKGNNLFGLAPIRFYFTRVESFSFSYREKTMEGVTKPWQELAAKLDMVRVEGRAAKGEAPDILVAYPRFLDFQGEVKP